ncbi:hypothetical protein CK203_004762 [Vitis vinifera]|uniref:Uncharacterized protein n=1 Tax=Vitis vinifera TaxID=29760 RepID=A0A438KG25_VITVI|nr:hypothetical protein CK203_004762 [Vitis vinifera]
MVITIGRGDNDTMFPPAPFNLTSFIQDCTSLYDIPLGLIGSQLTMEAIFSIGLRNIIFSNGLRDPYSSAG